MVALRDWPARLIRHISQNGQNDQLVKAKLQLWLKSNRDKPVHQCPAILAALVNELQALVEVTQQVLGIHVQSIDVLVLETGLLLQRQGLAETRLDIV